MNITNLFSILLATFVMLTAGCKSEKLAVLHKNVCLDQVVVCEKVETSGLVPSLGGRSKRLWAKARPTDLSCLIESCAYAQMGLMNPANPASPLSPMNPINPASPLNPMNMDYDDEETERCEVSCRGEEVDLVELDGRFYRLGGEEMPKKEVLRKSSGL